MKHLLKLADLSGSEILSVINLADQLKYELKHGVRHERLSGKTLGMIFTKASTRTRVSFETGMYQLGGNAMFLSGFDLQLGRGEPICDTARVLSRYLDGIMIRTFHQSDVEDLAKSGTIPVINGLTDYCHPCQVLADLMTVREYKGGFKNLKLCYVGDGNNMANSLIVGAVKTGMNITLACPEGYDPDPTLIEWGRASGLLTLERDPIAAAKEADVVYTDVWASMGQESEAKARAAVFKNYCVGEELLENAKKDVMVLHCLPAHRGEEITEQAFEAHADEIFDQAENRLHAQKAVLVKLLEK